MEMDVCGGVLEFEDDTECQVEIPDEEPLHDLHASGVVCLSWLIMFCEHGACPGCPLHALCKTRLKKEQMCFWMLKARRW